MNKFIIVGLSLAFIGAILAPFIAATTPDGLEKTLEEVKNPGVEEKSALEPPMPDYTIPFLGESPISGAASAIIGMILAFGLSYGVGLMIKKRKSKENGD